MELDDQVDYRLGSQFGPEIFMIFWNEVEFENGLSIRKISRYIERNETAIFRSVRKSYISGYI